MEVLTTMQVSFSSTAVIQPSVEYVTQDHVHIHVLVPQTHLVVSMNLRYYSTRIASELQNIYMKRFHLEPRHMPILRKRYGVFVDMETTYDEAHAVLLYGTTVEQRNRERLT